MAKQSLAAEAAHAFLQAARETPGQMIAPWGKLIKKAQSASKSSHNSSSGQFVERSDNPKRPTAAVSVAGRKPR